MNTSEFKENTFNAIIRHGNSIILPVAAITALLMVISFLSIRIIFVSFLGMDPDIFESLGNRRSPEEMQEVVNQLKALGISALLTGALMYLVFLVFTIWVYNLMFQASQAKLEGVQNVLGTAFSRSLNSSMWNLLWVTLIIYIGVGACAFIASLIVALVMGPSSGFAVLIVILLVFFIFLIFLRLLAAFPATAIGHLGPVNAISFSFQHITWRRSFIILIILISVLVVMVIVFGIVGAVIKLANASAFMRIPLMFVLYTVVYAYGTSAFTALYYKFADTYEEESPADHLVE